MRSIPLAALLLVAACHASPAPARRPVLRGRVSVAESTHAPAARRRGLLFMYWMTADEYKAAVSGAMGIRSVLLVFERSTLLGRVDLSQPGASAPFEIDVVPGDIVVSAVLDSSDELVDTLTDAISRIADFLATQRA